MTANTYMYVHRQIIFLNCEVYSVFKPQHIHVSYNQQLKKRHVNYIYNIVFIFDNNSCMITHLIALM